VREDLRMVLPVHDVNPLRRAPVVTWLLIAINVFVFVFLEPVVSSIGGVSRTSVAAACSQEAYFDRWGAIPKELMHNKPSELVPTGDPGPITNGQATCSIDRPAYKKIPALSVLTAMFLHGSWLHLLGNMLFLLIFGNNVEDRMGRLKYLFFYLFCGYAATYGFALFKSGSTESLVGASGAIAGVLGAYLVTFPRARVVSLLTFFFFIPVPLPAWVVLGSWFVLQYLYFTGVGVATGGDVAYGAHVVGFVVGALLVLPFLDQMRRGGPPKVRGQPSW
jgi:membrane associated rhomboid family serine protease